MHSSSALGEAVEQDKTVLGSRKECEESIDSLVEIGWVMCEIFVTNSEKERVNKNQKLMKKEMLIR